jgi:hypothetical protein
MKILNKSSILLIITITLSCNAHKIDSNRSNPKVILYKQATTADDAELSFDKKNFWKSNFEENTFIYQIFADNQYHDIINRVKKMSFRANTGPEYFNSVGYAFIVEEKNKKNNDTVYYDGYEKWWLSENGKKIMYEDKDKKLSKDLRLFYPIFRSCGYDEYK